MPAIADLYHPAAPPKVGILSVAGALDAHEQQIEAVLAAAGHAALRRFARFQPRVGELAPRSEDVLEFLDLYGHEYALVALRGWAAVRGAEVELVTRAIGQGCRVLWLLRPGDPRDEIEAAGAVVHTG